MLSHSKTTTAFRCCSVKVYYQRILWFVCREDVHHICVFMFRMIEKQNNCTPLINFTQCSYRGHPPLATGTVIWDYGASNRLHQKGVDKVPI